MLLLSSKSINTNKYFYGFERLQQSVSYSSNYSVPMFLYYWQWGTVIVVYLIKNLNILKQLHQFYYISIISKYLVSAYLGHPIRHCSIISEHPGQYWHISGWSHNLIFTYHLGMPYIQFHIILPVAVTWLQQAAWIPFIH